MLHPPSHLIQTTRLGTRVRTLEVWFDEDPGDVSGYDLVVYHQRSTPINSIYCLFYYTILIDLDLAPEALLAQMGNGNPQQIRRALGKDRIVCSFSFPPSPEEIEEFLAFYDDGAAPGGEEADRGQMDLLAKAGLLALSAARGPDGQVLARHSYVCHTGQQRARCDLSKTLQTDPRDSEVRSALSRANRLLHYQDMLALQHLGIKTYDFGGWYSGKEDSKRLNINRFKEGFGGRIVREFENSEPLTLAGTAYLDFRLLKWIMADKKNMKDFIRRVHWRRKNKPQVRV